MSSIGRENTHDSAIGHVTGTARYVDDQPVEQGQLHVALGLSTIAHGLISSINLDAVRNSPGVVGVLTFADLPHATDIGPVFEGDPLLVNSNVEFMGQAVFAVAARSHRQARQAVQLADIIYQELPATFDVTEAMRAESYVRPPHHMARGDAARALILKGR